MYGYNYDAILSWLRREVQQAGRTLNEQQAWLNLVLEAAEEIDAEIEAMRGEARDG